MSSMLPADIAPKWCS